MTLDPNVAAGAALTISNTATQTSGQLAKITGVAGQTALNVAAGSTVLDPNSAAGGGLVVQNTAGQTSGELAKITGSSGQTALKVTPFHLFTFSPFHLFTFSLPLPPFFSFVQSIHPHFPSLTLFLFLFLYFPPAFLSLAPLASFQLRRSMEERRFSMQDLRQVLA
jgi:hypothetical protein